MKYEVTTKQGNNYIVSDDSVWMWIELERELGYTVTEAAAKMIKGSLDVISFVLYKSAFAQSKTQLKTQRAWVENEFETFKLVDEPDPKDNLQTALSE
jgi:hypothetical protein